jgi:hypothetical protein
LRPILREVAGTGGEPQLLVNGLAQMLRDVATSIEQPLGGVRTDHRGAASPADPGGTGLDV